MVIGVAGTATEIGKTWLSAALIRSLKSSGVSASARKPTQSYHPTELLQTDAEILATAAGEKPNAVCPAERWYPVPMAPPMAADFLGVEQPTTASLLSELSWGTPCPDIGLVETVGGVKSPLASDADSARFLDMVEPDVVILVAHAGLGTINDVRLSAGAIADIAPVIVFLNGFDGSNDLHGLNRDWLEACDGYSVETSVAQLARRLRQRL